MYTEVLMYHHDGDDVIPDVPCVSPTFKRFDPFDALCPPWNYDTGSRILSPCEYSYVCEDREKDGTSGSDDSTIISNTRVTDSNTTGTSPNDLTMDAIPFTDLLDTMVDWTTMRGITLLFEVESVASIVKVSSIVMPKDHSNKELSKIQREDVIVRYLCGYDAAFAMWDLCSHNLALGYPVKYRIPNIRETLDNKAQNLGVYVNAVPYLRDKDCTTRIVQVVFIGPQNSEDQRSIYTSPVLKTFGEFLWRYTWADDIPSNEMHRLLEYNCF